MNLDMVICIFKFSLLGVLCDRGQLSNCSDDNMSVM